MPAHELAGIGKGDLGKDFIHVLPTLFIEHFLKLAVGTAGPSLAQPCRAVKNSIAGDRQEDFFRPFGDCLAKL